VRIPCCGCEKVAEVNPSGSFADVGWIVRETIHPSVGKIKAWYCSETCYKAKQEKKKQ